MTNKIEDFCEDKDNRKLLFLLCNSLILSYYKKYKVKNNLTKQDDIIFEISK